MQRKLNFDTGDLFTNGESHRGKTPPHRVILTSPLPRIHYYQNKRLQVKGIPVPNTNLQLNPYPIPSWTCNGVTISPFNA